MSVCLVQVELSQLQTKIVDLLPPNIARRMLGTNKRGGGAGGVGGRRGTTLMTTQTSSLWLNSCERYQAVVLQLDLCRFTVLSQTLEPIQVIVHPLSFRWPMVRNFPFSLFP